jgi:hypothetical protein
MKDEIVICSNRKRQILECDDYYFIYVPMTRKEIKMFECKHIINACWRILKTK